MLLDGLVASAVPEVLVPRAGRLRPVVLVHLPLETDAEARALAAAAGVVTTSEWTRRRLLDRYPLPADRVRVAAPAPTPRRRRPARRPARPCSASPRSPRTRGTTCWPPPWRS
ncbi:hypothetical protein MRQ36_25280 [Micromonospora sp. R77]|uniref:hypothetical protein n=1 Tax=Micromonospora sp. R77 TaxID=2925836 RepID=UPI001F62181A|nr:hypothetical protein [Micromonospora sp. R77]MCI4065689.1 hypothetical protein [Micromonospora sp. R77]